MLVAELSVPAAFNIQKQARDGDVVQGSCQYCRVIAVLVDMSR